jgi:type I site-specific restriction endonuclease
LIARRAVYQAELKRLDEEIRAIEDLRRQQIQSIQDVTQQIDALDERVASEPAFIQNYYNQFEWSGRLREQMRKVFGIENFRLAQEGYAIFTTRTAWSPLSMGNTACAMQIWTEETSFASCPLVSGI